jgi:hypothetical protein
MFIATTVITSDLTWRHWTKNLLASGEFGFVTAVLLKTEAYVSASLRFEGSWCLHLRGSKRLTPLTPRQSVTFLTTGALNRRVPYAVKRPLTTEIRSEERVVRWFRRCANVIQCTYTNPDSTAHYTVRYTVQPIAARLQTCTACYCTEYCRQL